MAAALTPLLALPSPAQKSTENLAGSPFLNGFVRAVSGEVIGYHSFHPYAKSALLARVTDGTKSIEWETARIPLDFTEEFAHFVWIAGHFSGTSSGNRTFHLFIDNEEWIAFTTTPNKGLRQWVFTGKDGAELKFRAEWEDTACITLESIRPLR